MNALLGLSFFPFSRASFTPEEPFPCCYSRSQASFVIAARAGAPEKASSPVLCFTDRSVKGQEWKESARQNTYGRARIVIVKPGH